MTRRSSGLTSGACDRIPVVRVCLTGLGSGLILAVVLAQPVGAVQVPLTPQAKVTICHRTNSVLNPYNQQSVNQSSIVMPDGTPAGHGLHTGPVFPQPNWGDIIPQFTYNNTHKGTSVYPGMNWDTDGQAIWLGGCGIYAIEPPEETTTTTPTLPTTTRPGSSTTTPTRWWNDDHPATTHSHPNDGATRPASSYHHRSRARRGDHSTRRSSDHRPGTRYGRSRTAVRVTTGHLGGRA
jgi:hypothetical protein